MKTSHILLVSTAILVGIILLAGCSASRRTGGSEQYNQETYSAYYGTTKGDQMTGSVSKLKTTGKERASYANMYDYLRGRVPGVQVSPNGSIIIRGVSTNSGQTDPLILVDGVEVTTLDNVDPSTVESVEVIKDGTSAIYGMRGQNGVIIITTKKK